jgi:HEAT repeat protein
MYPDVQAFLKRIASPDPAVRAAALKEAAQQDPAALAGLADLMSHSDKAIAKAAKTAMERLTHGVLKPAPGKDKPNSDDGRGKAADQLVEIAMSSRPRMTRAHALYLAGFAGERMHEALVADLEKDKDVGEDARMALQRMRSVRF